MSFQPDWALVLGIMIAVLSIPSALTALAERRAPRMSAVLILLAGGLVLWALRMQPGGYSLYEIPEAFIRVLADIIN